MLLSLITTACTPMGFLVLDAIQSKSVTKSPEALTTSSYVSLSHDLCVIAI